LTISILLSGLFAASWISVEKLIWQMGENNNSGEEFAQAANDYARFIEKYFGWEDKYFLIGNSDEKTDCSYTLPT